MHTISQIVIEVIDSVFGAFDVTLFKRLNKHKNNVTSKPILPGTESVGITKLGWNKTKKRFFKSLWYELYICKVENCFWCCEN